jgi:hypothetical protein
MSRSRIGEFRSHGVATVALTCADGVFFRPDGGRELRESLATDGAYDGQASAPDRRLIDRVHTGPNRQGLRRPGPLGEIEIV